MARNDVDHVDYSEAKNDNTILGRVQAVDLPSKGGCA